MCGRYSLTNPAEFLEHRLTFEPPTPSRPLPETVTPGRDALVIVAPRGEHIPARMTWGFPNTWEPTGHRRIINARAETAHSKPTFRTAFGSKRCLVAADSFFETARTGHTSQQYRITLPEKGPFAMAGLWRRTTTEEGEPVFEFVILTVPPNDTVAPIHNRMPAILLPEHEEAWLDANIQAPGELRALLKPYPANLTAMPVQRETLKKPRC